MIRHCVAHPFGRPAAVHRSKLLCSNPARVLTPPLWASDLLCSQKQKTDHRVGSLKFGGEGGIRTLDTLPYTHFPGVLLQPLGHLTKFLLTALLRWNGA